MNQNLINQLRTIESRSKRELLDTAADAIERLQSDNAIKAEELRRMTIERKTPADC